MSLRVKGFRFSGISAGIKASGALDLGLIAADEPTVAAGVFTQNSVRAAPVVISERRLRGGRCQAVLVNSGNANACTGREGHHTAVGLTEAIASALGVAPKLVVPASTGVIGVQMPTRKVERAMPALVAGLSRDGASEFSRAILTTDQGPKIAHATFKVGSTSCRLLGIAKGAGMIHPSLATTLAFVTTDASIHPTVLRRALAEAARVTFNRATVDGDTSTNDSIYALASGKSSARTIAAESGAGARFTRALTEVLEQLAKMIVTDGEGAQHLVRVQVTGARTEAAAVQLARTIACSQLVKTALHGCDPNWGRILAAAGRSGVAFNPERTTVRIGDVAIFERGRPTMTPKKEGRATRVMQRREYTVTLDVGKGRGAGHYWTCDLGHEYVRINADYRS